MALVHYEFHDFGRPISLCGRAGGTLSDHGPNVTCGQARRGWFPKNPDKVDCKICRKLLGMGRAAPKQSRWDLIGDEDVLFGGGV